MHLDPSFQEISLVLFVLLTFGIFSKLLNLPNAIGFLVAGVCLGPDFLGVVDKTSVINQIGSAGVVLLLFFIGLEVSPKEVIKDWKITIIGTLLQVLLSVLCVFILGAFLDWPFARMILLGFVISLSSSAMVIKFLKDNDLIGTRIGKDTLGILITQDIFVIPMLIIIGLLGGEGFSAVQFSKQIFGSIFLVLIFIFSSKINVEKIQFLKRIRSDKELILLFCLSFTFGLALISGVAELSTAFGAFVAGGIIGQLKLGDMFQQSLEPFQVVMVAIFFSSIGLMLDLQFFTINYKVIILLTIMTLLTNTLINALVLKFLGRSWSDSLITGSYLSQIGEFSFILAAIGLKQGVINVYGYQTTIYIIFLSIVFTPLWIKLISQRFKMDNSAL